MRTPEVNLADLPETTVPGMDTEAKGYVDAVLRDLGLPPLPVAKPKRDGHVAPAPAGSQFEVTA